MSLETVNPVTGKRERQFAEWSQDAIEAALRAAQQAASGWRARGFAARATVLRQAAAVLREHVARYAGLITLEMGKPIREARAEIEKCAWVCEFYAERGAEFLKDEVIQTDGTRSFVAYEPLGPVLAIMPWNFPFWQVFRFAAPALMGGNVGLLKLASNVPQCSLAIADVWRAAGAPEGVFQSLLVSAATTEQLIGDPRIKAVTLTGSEAAGRRIAHAAGQHLKKTVLELGGSDAFIVLPDADLDLAATTGVASRFLNGGQSCIAAKRFIVVESVAAAFLDRFVRAAAALKVGDPQAEDTQMGPLARADLRDALQAQVDDARTRGARVLLGGQRPSGPGCFYPPTVIDGVRPGMRAYSEELFGPVATVLHAASEEQALEIANDNPYGLGGSIWSRDEGRAEALARRLESGSAFINGLVKSDPRLPFGGIKASGYGRELSAHGIREFVNAKTVWIR